MARKERKTGQQEEFEVRREGGGRRRRSPRTEYVGRIRKKRKTGQQEKEGKERKVERRMSGQVQVVGGLQD